MEQNHSLLPWKLNEGTYLQSAKWVSDGNGKVIVHKLHEVTRTEEANARFIVQACNAHGVLLQACKDALYYLRQCEMDFSLPPSAKTMKDILEEAIAKTESK